MTRLTDLPSELLTMIIRHADTLYERNTGLEIFSLMRVNRTLRDIAILVHLGDREAGQPTAPAKILTREKCYLNHKRQVRREACLPCDRATLQRNSPRIRPHGRCPKGHLRTLLNMQAPPRVAMFCLVRQRRVKAKQST